MSRDARILPVCWWVTPTTLLIALVTLSPAVAQEPSEDEQFAAHVRRLTPTTPKAERLEQALAWLRKRCSSPAAPGAMSAVERCVREDKDAEVRTQAVEVLGMTAYQQRTKVCPLAVVEALLDRDPGVRGIAMGCSSMYRAFAPGCVAVLLKGARHEEPSARENVVWLLGTAAAKDEMARQVIRAARDDKHFQVRHAGHATWFRLTGKLDEFLPYALRVQAEGRAEPPLAAGSSDEAKREREARNLIRMGLVLRLQELGKERPDEMAKAVRGYLDDPAPVLRCEAARHVGSAARFWMFLRNPPKQPLFLTPSDLPSPDPAKEPQKAPEGKGKDDPSAEPKVLVRLRELGAEKRLAQMQREDPDREVREAAAEALKAWAAARAKQP